ncbi:MAG: CinA family protein [Candidatus Izemoplasmatales bacterium]
MKDSSQQVSDLSYQLVHLLIKKNLRISFAESITGGLFASELTRIEDASKVFHESFVVYSDQAKVNVLQCKKSTIDKYTVYSKQVIEEMLLGLRKQSEADILVAVSGIAGPRTYHDLDIGTVFIGIDYQGQIFNEKLHFSGDRQEIRYQTIIFTFNKIIEYLNK